MSTKKMESVFNTVLLALQICLGFRQFSRIQQFWALIQGVMGWLLRPLRLSSTYVRLQCCNGRVFKKVNSYVLQADIPPGRPGIHGDGVNNIQLNYFGEESYLERNLNMLRVNGKMCYYITDRNWQELLAMRDALSRELAANSYAARAAAAAAARAADATALAADARRAAAHRAAAYAAAHGAREAAEAREAAYAAREAEAAAREANATAHEAEAAAREANATACDADAVVFIKSRKDFSEEVIMGRMMTLDEVLEGVILDNQCVSHPPNNHWFLPVEVLVSEEKVLKVLNLFALFLQTNKEKVNWLIPTALSILTALLEINTTIKEWLYACINAGFCYIVHFIYDPFPRLWRQQVYSLGQGVENLKPCNDIELMVKRGNITAIITVGAKIDKCGATLVHLLDIAYEENEKHFYCKHFYCKPIG